MDDEEVFPGCVAAAPGDDPPRPLSPDDDGRYWILDFHFPRGLTPLGLTTFAPSYAEGTRAGARALGIPGSDGLSIRFQGPHLYVSPRQPPAEEQARRSTTFAAAIERSLDGFRARWSATAAALDEAAAAMLDAPAPVTAREAAASVERAVAHERWAWRVHFEEMYVVLAGHLAYRDGAASLGVPPALADACLAGEPSRPQRADEALVALAEAFRDAGVSTADEVRRRPALAAQLDELVERFGSRSDSVADVAAPSWREAPDRPLARALALARHRLPLAEVSRVEDGRRARRERARGEARGMASDARAFDALLARAERANWIWWNEEHNEVIDLRASLPLRKAALEAGSFVLDDPAEVFLLGVDELLDVLRGGPRPARALLDTRQRWLDGWRSERSALPPSRGELTADLAADPVIAEIFGVTLGVQQDGRTVRGLGTSPGTATGGVRVVHTADELDLLGPGDVLVCEATSPNWAYAYTLVAAVVCDNGGPTTHAAIAAREYRVPCVVSARGATRWLRDGQRVEVNGDTGVVRLLG